MSTAGPEQQEKARSCPMCGRPSAAPYRPFCSRHCKQLDLLRWLNEDYRVPAVEEDKGDDEDGGDVVDEEER